MKRNRGIIVRVISVVFILVLILVNPIPVIVSASEDAANGFFKEFLGSPPPATAPIAPDRPSVDTKKLSKYITVEAAFLGLTDNLSVYFKDLNSGKEFSISPEKSWIPASTIKAYVAAEAFHQRHQGLINFNTLVTIQADNVVPNGLESDDFPRLREGVQATIGQLVQAMIIQSDNTAYNTMLDVLDRRNVQAYVKNLGIENTIIGEKLNVDDNQLRADSVNPGYRYNVTTAEDYKTLFDLMYSHKIPDSDELLAIFKRQKSNAMIPALIPGDTPVAHKTGEWAPIYHDGGIVYKPGSPFIISLFSNSNKPSDLAKIAQIAYYDDADHVDVNLSKSVQQKSLSSTTDKIILAEVPSEDVLGTSTTNLTSPITAADLGITTSDLETVPTDQSKIPYTLITPASPLYGLKIFVENFRLSRASDSEKAALRLKFAEERLSELKSVSGAYSQNYIQTINNNFHDNLKVAAQLSEKSPDKDTLLLKAKTVSDLHFMVLGNSVAKVSTAQKEKFIDDAYNSLTKNDKEIAPIVKNSPLALATKNEPIVGTIQSVKDGVASITLDNGKTAQIEVSDSTKVRAFNDTKTTSPDSLTSGDKIAVIGKQGVNGIITSTFVMKDVPKVLPKTKGIVIEIQPKDNLIKIQNSSGQEQSIKVDNDTTIQSKDTGVSLEGIKAGSVITVTGTVDKNSPVVQSPVPSGNKGQNTVTGKTVPSGSKPTGATNIKITVPAAPTIDAQRVVINVNGSGKEEKVEKKQSKSEQKSGSKPPQQTNTKPNPALAQSSAPAPVTETKKVTVSTPPPPSPK